MAAGPARADTQSPTAPPPLWPLLCSAVLVGMLIASGVARLTAAWDDSRPPCNRRFWDRPQHRRAAAAQHERAQEPGRGRHAQAPWQITLARLERHPLAHL